MADPSWLDKNNITSVRLKTSTGTVEIGQLEAFGLFGQTFLVILYSLSTFFALTGNTLVILVEIYGRRSARNLQKFLINLAISDLLLGVLVTPFIYTDIMLGRWIFHPLLCPVTQFVQLMSVFVTTYTLTFIGIERYFATLHPLSSANTWLRSHGNLVLQLSWIFGSILASFSIQNTRVVAFNYNSQTYYDCANWVDVAERDMQIYVTLSFVLTFVLPIIFLTISYGAIGRRLMRTQKYWCSYRQTIPFSSHHHSHSHHSHNQNSTSRTHSNNNSNSSHNHNLSNVDNEGNNNNNNNPTVTAVVAAPSVTTTTTRKNKSLIRKNFTKISKLSNSNVHHQTNGGNGNDDNNTTTVTTSNNSLNKKSNNKNQNKVIVRFDKRNAEFLNKMRVFRLLVAVLVLFIICWLPIKIFMLILAFRPSIVYLDSITNYYIYYISFFLCHWLSMANSFANPILYCFMSKSFRADLCDLFVCICTKLNICIKSCETLKENHHPHHHTGGNHHHHQQHYHHHNDYHDQQRNPLHYKSLLYDHPNDKIKIQEKLQQQQPQKPYNYCLASIKESNITNPNNLEDDDNGDIDNELIDSSIKKLTLCKQQHSSSSLESLEQIDQLPIPLVITTTTQSSQSSSELHRSPQTSSSSSSSDWKNKQLKFINCKHKFLSINSTNDVNDPDDDIDVVVENIPVVVVEQQQQQASKVFAFFKLNSMSK